jgi:predicted ferric reductase
VAAAVAWTSLLVVTALWVGGRGIQGLSHGSAAALTSVGRLAGLWSADLLLIQVLLMARLPVLERTIGRDRLVRWHRIVGFTSFDLLVGHVVLITLGYAATDRRGALAEAWNLVTTYPGMLLATAAFALLVMVAVTSARRARRRLRYESWHLLHLYAYLGVGLAIPHQLWSGSDFATSGWAQAYWWSLFAVTIASVLACRVVLPLVRSACHRLRVAGVVAEAPGVWSVYVEGRHLDRLGARAGQFLNWRFLAGSGWTRAHPFSLSAAPRAEVLRITVKDLGDDTRRIGRLRVGTRVLIEGPYGRLTAEARSRRRITLIGAGIGVTPLRALVEELPYAEGEAVMIVRSSDGRPLFHRELAAIAAERGARFVHLPGRRRGNRSWLPASAPAWSDAQALVHLVPDIARHDVFVCGPDAWMDAVCRAARRAGVPPAQVHTERFAW